MTADRTDPGPNPMIVRFLQSRMRPVPAAPIAALDVDLRLLEQRIAQHRVEASAARLRWLLAHPDDAPTTPASAGELAEYRHLLYDADEDATTPAFPYPTPEETR